MSACHKLSHFESGWKCLQGVENLVAMALVYRHGHWFVWKVENAILAPARYLRHEKEHLYRIKKGSGNWASSHLVTPASWYNFHVGSSCGVPATSRSCVMRTCVDHLIFRLLPSISDLTSSFFLPRSSSSLLTCIS